MGKFRKTVKRYSLLGELLPELNPHAGQRLILEDSHRFQVIAAGRRWGKSHVALAKAAQVSVLHPGCRIWIVSPNFSQQEQLFDKALFALGAQHRAFIRSDNPSGLFIKEQRLARGYRKFILFNDSVIEFKSAESGDSLRGAGSRIQFIVVDEAAYVDPYAWKILRFTLVDHRAPAFLISTPNAHTTHDDFFYKRYLWGQEEMLRECPVCFGSGCDACSRKGVVSTANPDKKADYRSWRFSSYDNPFIAPEEIDALIADEGLSDSDVRREIYAEFIEGEGAVFPLEVIAQCQAGTPEGFQKGVQYVMGLDFGKIHDYTVAIVLRADNGHVVHMERFQGSWGYQREMIRRIFLAYGAPHTIVDATSTGDVIMEDLMADGLSGVHGYTFNGPSKMRVIDRLRVALETRSITFPHEFVEIGAELAHLNARRLPASGLIQYSAAKGYYDDCVVALALAWLGCNELRGGSRGPCISVALLGAS